ncbi:MAG: glycosyltransferase family 1 protein [Dehalococcoidia bacterium]|nr:MAG: glycosyltransferase family 1 protein [Dehalococcoidia bacterium]
MKVLVVSSRAIRGVYGLYEYNLCRKLAEKGIDVHSISLLGDNSTYSKNSTSLSKQKGIFFRFQEIFSIPLAKHLLKNDYDVIHLNGAFWSSLPLQVAIVKKITRQIKPLVLTTHAFAPEYLNPVNVSIKKFFTSLDAKFLLYGLRCYAYSLVDHIICMSNIERKHVLKEFGIEEKLVSAIPNGVDLTRINVPSYDFRISRKINSKFMLLYVGQLIEMKGIPYLLQAFKLLIDKGFDAVLVLISYTGSKNNKFNISEQIKKLKLQPHVIILSGMTEKDLIAAYNACDVFILPSVFDEASNTAILESMACRKPVIGTNVDGIPEVVRNGQNGFVVEPRNSFELAEKLSLILDSAKLRAQFGENSFKLVRQRYDWDLIVDRIIDVYRKVIV